MNHYELYLIVRATSVPEERVRERMGEFNALSVEFCDSVCRLRMTTEAANISEAFHRLRALVESSGFRVVGVGPDDLNNIDELAARMNRPPEDVARWVNNSRALRFPEVRAWFGGRPHWSWCEVADWAFRHRFIDRQAFKDAFELFRTIEMLRAFVDQEDDEVNDFVQSMPTKPPPGGFKRDEFD